MIIAIGNYIGNNRRSGPSLDPDYRAVLDYATAQGYTLPSTEQQVLQNTLLVDLKNAGVWAKLDSFANFATDGDSNFALIDWKRLVQYTTVNSPSFTTNKGFQGNGTSSYIDTNFDPLSQGINYTQNNASRYIFVERVSGTILDGNTSQGQRISISATTAQRINQGTGTINASYGFSALEGMKSIHRTSSTNVELFSDTTQASRTATSNNSDIGNQFILRSSTTYSSHRISMYAMGASLVSENTAFVNAYNNYLLSIAPTFDADYQAVLNYATTQGYTLPTLQQRIRQNQLVLDLKLGGIWTKLDTFANFATNGDANFALIDWKRLTQYTAVNSPTFTSNQGFTGNGTSSYINTNFNAVTQGTNYIQDNASRYAYMFTASGTGALDGKSVASINNMTRASTGNQRINQGTIGLTGGSFDFTSTQGMKSIHRTNSTNVELFNATTQGSRTATSASMNSNSQFVLRSGSVYGAHTISMYANGASLVSENTNFVNAFNTYISSL